MLNVEIKVKGRIDPQWSEWFDSLTITHLEPDQSKLTGTMVDQAALYGILSKLRNLSLALISVSVDSVVIECKNDTCPGYERIKS